MKIDLTTIAGYEAMTPEQKVAALEGFEFDMSELEALREANKTQKGLIDKYTGEIGALKKSRNEGLTEAEKRARMSEEALKELQEKFDAMAKKNTISDYMAKYLSLGYEKELARETAEALADGDMDKVFANAEKFTAEKDKKAKAEAALKTPRPEGGIVKYKTKDEIMKIRDTSERQKAIQENLELFE